MEKRNQPMFTDRLCMAKPKSQARFHLDKHTLDKYWVDLLEFVKYSRPHRTEYLYHSTKLKYRRNIDKLGCLEGTHTDVPKVAPLALNEELEGVWFDISLFYGKSPEKSPYGSHMIHILAPDIINFMKTPTPLPFPVESNNSDEDDMFQIVFTNSFDSDSDSDLDSWPRATEERTDKTDVVPATDKLLKDLDAYVNKNIPLPEVSMCPRITFGGQGRVTPLLFFESAFFDIRGQYVRFVLIRSDDPHVPWCEGHLKRVNLCNNPFCRWDPTFGSLYTIRHNRDIRQFVFTFVKVVGDVPFEGFASPPKWKHVTRVRLFPGAPTFGVNFKKSS